MSVPLVAALVAVGLATPSPALVHTSFDTNLGSGFNGRVSAIAVQPDGKVVVGGDFTTLNGVAVRPRLVRLNANGSLDSTFTGNRGLNGVVNTVAVQSDGSILVGGSFTYSAAGRTVKGLIRLLPDGTQDLAYAARLGSGFDNNVLVVKPLKDGSALVGGGFTRLSGVTVPQGLIRINADGTRNVDPARSFNTTLGTGFSNYVASIAVQGTRFLIGGDFTSLNGRAGIPDRLVRLLSSGAPDGTFGSALGSGLNSDVLEIIPEPSGKVVIAGAFGDIPGHPRSGHMVRLTSVGEVDPAWEFASGFFTVGLLDPQTIFSAVRLADGSIVAGGTFTQFQGSTVNRLLRVTPSGSLDSAFARALDGGVSGGSVFDLALRPDSSVLVAGTFTTLGSGPTPNGLTRLIQVPTLTHVTTTSVTGRTATVTFNNPTVSGGSPITSIEATAARLPDGLATGSCSVSAGAATCTGLASGDVVIFVRAVNSAGKGPSENTRVTIPNVPSAVRNLAVAFPSTGTARATWSPPLSNGGATITRFETCVASCTFKSSWVSTGNDALGRPRLSVTRSGIPRGTAITLRVRAVNAAGTGAIASVSFTQPI